MSAPYRIARSGPEKAKAHKPGRNVAQASISTREGINDYLIRLIKMLPAEALSLYLVGAGIIQSADSLETKTVPLAIWAGVCLIGVIVLRVYGTADPQKRKPTDWVHVGISGVAFVLWVYSMPGGPFDVSGIYQGWLASLLILAWTFFVPILYKGPEN